VRTPAKISQEVYLLFFSVPFLFGWVTGCAPTLVEPTESTSALVIGRVIIDYRQQEDFFGALPAGIIKEGIAVEVESWDRRQLFNVRTDEEGYFFIPNIPSNNTYHVRRLSVERGSGAPRGGLILSTRGFQLGVGTLAFTPVAGKVGYVGTVIVDVDERGITDTRELREAQQARAHFIQKWRGSGWTARELVSAGTKLAAGAATAQGKPTVSPLPSDLPEQVSVPFKRRGQQVVVEATVNGSVSSSFIVDTGASFTMISRALASGLEIDLNRKLPTVTLQTAGGIIKAPLVVLDSIEVGGMKMEELTAVVHDFSRDPSVPGILGLNFLSHFRLEIDAQKGLLVLRRIKAQ
jgi:clan AA aspartic protease (TIGR02281 family)